MTDAGLFFITAIDAADDYDIATLRLLNDPHEILVVTVGRNDLQNTAPDLHLEEVSDIVEAIEQLADLLTLREIIEDFQI